MALVELKVPDIGGHENVDIIAVEVNVGDTIAVDDTLITLETDKATMDVPAEVAGVVKEVKVKVGDKISEGGVILTVETGAAAAEAAPAPAAEAQPAPAAAPAAAPAPVPARARPEQRVPMSRLRARVAERLLASQQENAILTTFNEVNMKPIMDLRAKYKEKFEKEHGVKLGFMSFFVKAAVAALKKYPVVNASVDGSDIVYHGYFDIGIALGRPRRDREGRPRRTDARQGTHPHRGAGVLVRGCPGQRGHLAGGHCR